MHGAENTNRDAGRSLWLFVGLIAALIGVHVWSPGPPSPPADGPVRLFGVLPWDLAFPLVWMAAAWAAIIVLVRWVWKTPRAPRANPHVSAAEDGANR